LEADGFVFLFGLLVAEGVLAGEFFIAGAEVGEDFGVEVLFFGFEGAGLADEAFAEGGVTGEAGIVFGDLFAEVFLFDIEEGLGIFAFEAADEETEETFNEIAETFEHGKGEVWVDEWCDGNKDGQVIPTSYFRNCPHEST
jgi:hypothetical protein